MLEKFIKDPGQRAIAGFLIKAVMLYIIWFISYDFFIAPDGRTDEWLNALVANHSASVLSILGFDGSTVPGAAQTVIRIQGKEMVGVGNPCNGLELFALFTGFVICFPGSWKQKWWFILIGNAGIHFVNVLRATTLAIIQFKSPEHLEFNHHYTFTVVVYSFIFLLWVTWANKFSKTGKQEEKNA